MPTRALTIVLFICTCTLPAGLSAAQAPASRQAAAAAIRKADENFCQATIDRDLDRFLTFVSEQATFGGGSDEPQRGRDAVAKAWAPFFQPGGPTLTWKPMKAEVLVGGDLGYTVGTWERRLTAKDGRPVVQHGQYLTVWKKQADGKWQVIFDGGSEEPAKRK